MLPWIFDKQLIVIIPLPWYICLTSNEFNKYIHGNWLINIVMVTLVVDLLFFFRYRAQSADLVFNENILLQTLGFDVAIDHPHTHVVRCCHLVRASKDLAQTSYFMASYRWARAERTYVTAIEPYYSTTPSFVHPSTVLLHRLRPLSILSLFLFVWFFFLFCLF